MTEIQRTRPSEGELAKLMVMIRHFEESLDELFTKGEIFGTFHRCIGQEATALAVTSWLDCAHDYVVSNHRNHGHYLSFTQDFKGLLAELKGSDDGVTGGIGGSQVIVGQHFLSNGILGSTVPLATGIALALKRESAAAMVACFIGDGAMGEGAVYEALNMAALWSLPILFVVEQNQIAQSTELKTITAGTLEDRLSAFTIPTSTISSTDVSTLISFMEPEIKQIRAGGGPRAVVVEAPRLGAHSKGDDDRGQGLLDELWAADPVQILLSRLDDRDAIVADAEQTLSEIYA